VVALLQDEVRWLNHLEKKLSQGPRPTCDAEELSEELDVCAILFVIINFDFYAFLGRLLRISWPVSLSASPYVQKKFFFSI